MRDVFTDAINSPPGRLAEVVLHKLHKGHGSELSDDVRLRLDRLIDAPGKAGLLGRVRLARDVPFLFEHAPNWTTSRVVPLFDWASPDAASVWSARKYSSYIGSPKLFGLIKQPFLQMFGRSDMQAQDLEKFAEWLTTILIANHAKAAGYPLLDTEARSALRKTGGRSLSSVGHRLAVEMQGAKSEEKIKRWQTVVGPVFRGIWPLDVELQTPAATFTLVRILLAAGEAFPEAADVIIPFIQPDDPRSQSTIHSIAEADEALYQAAPSKMLDMMVAVVGDAPLGSVYALGKALSRLRTISPALGDSRKFQKLLAYASRH
ncbi:hypothetical protein BRDID11004_16100 [Bradyrhizobium diazoefficiens]|uniref:Uncharacterized protein n=1 Tax=Bradyrhizobium diazoefficiens TaxID=1355477 RepID=A0A810A5B9_9BRAD|nr:hypothetical protein [Bradyrhizobium diazoefficiens]BBZ97479.1 hypothetical protein F07S3_73120 [Bradyrhizobium diazoefficiens]BCA15163.1 hypothetical protein BDHF08_70100 [Bradyrhizobium diazoefficiens]BCE59575.1 hypothetical protein XF5B_70870 [Bradyrhizobium diazoefficiens]BCE68258.1 hypothetical protein XF6B_70570 [Bradyrhizobium diazoefficiens]